MEGKKKIPLTAPVRAITTIDQFYQVMHFTRDIRRMVVRELLVSGQYKEEKPVEALKEAQHLLRTMPQKGRHYLVAGLDNEEVQLDLSYEIDELTKDVLFMEKGHTALLAYLSELHADFSVQVHEAVTFLAQHPFLNFISDRDGTVNNYCGRYLSSVQSIYNAVFLTRFARHIKGEAVILTSAPLISRGLANVTVTPPYTFIYAGSKGREILDTGGDVYSYPLSTEEQERLQRLNNMLTILVEKPEYKIFSLIGSGLQFKRGEITLARQDIYHSISEDKSTRLKQHVESLVAKVDPDQTFFRIDDTGKDLEIVLMLSREDQAAEPKDFDKGDGIEFIDATLDLKLSKGPNLICGDTGSDLPMVTKSMQYAAPTLAVFVTRDEVLREKVTASGAEVCFVTEPDILVTALYSSTL